MGPKPVIRKQRRDTVLYGTDIARGPCIYCAYDGDKLVAVGATVEEAKRKYRRIWAEEMTRPARQADEQGGGGDANLYNKSP
jgi:hypothetical protein